MSGRIPALAGAALAAAMAGGVLAAASMPVLLSGGSDALNTVFAPPREGQVAAVALIGGLVFFALRRGGVARLACCAAALVLLALAAHRVVIDRASGEIRDSVALLTVQRLALPDDAEAAVAIAQGVATLRFATASGAAMTVLRGPPGLALAARP